MKKPVSLQWDSSRSRFCKALTNEISKISYLVLHDYVTSTRKPRQALFAYSVQPSCRTTRVHLFYEPCLWLLLSRVLLESP